MGDEQRYNARALLDTIPERHFPQRFEHPVLRLFRIIAAVLLPAYLLTGMLMAVQLPSSVQIRTQTALAFAPPLLDLTRFPNDLIAGKATSLTAAEASAFSAINLTKLANRAVQLQPSPPRLDPLGTTSVVLIIMVIYLLVYTAFGLAVITFSSPAQFQGRRPGRLVLSKDSLNWRGPAGQGSLMDALEWLKQDARWVVARLWQRLHRLVRARGQGQRTCESRRQHHRAGRYRQHDSGGSARIRLPAARFLLHGAGAERSQTAIGADPRLDRSLHRAVR